MKYHFIIDGYAKDVQRQTEELNGFKDAFLTEIEEGESFILCDAEINIPCIAERAVLLLSPVYSPEAVLEELCREANSEDLYIFGSGFSGVELSVRMAERLKGSSVTGVHGLDIQQNLIARKMVYSNHMEGCFQLNKEPYCLSLAKGTERKAVERKNFCISKKINCKTNRDFIVSRETEELQSPGGLENSALVIVGGRGAKSREGIIFLQDTAIALGGELGVSRPAAMNAWAPMHKLIGVSGAMIQPEICIAAGVSGAAAFFAGVEKSKFIVAVNIDEKAPIMKKADVAVVEDYRPVMEAIRMLAEEYE
jgi:electron transfer flavoprotein alpha subunit